MSWFGGIYRHPPAPQRSRPSAVLPDEVFPSPPLGNRGRNIAMAIVAAQWIASPLPQQRLPAVTEAEVEAVEFVPSSRTQDQLIVDSWQIVPISQRSRSTAVLPTEVFDNPPLGIHDLQNDRIVDGWWRLGPQPQQQYPSVTESEAVEVFVPYIRERIVTGLWEIAPAIQQVPARAVLPVDAFLDPPAGQQKRQILDALVANQWVYIPQPEQRRPTVTEEGAPVVEIFVPFTRDHIVIALWIPPPIPLFFLQRQIDIASIIPPIVQITGGFLGRPFMS